MGKNGFETILTSNDVMNIQYGIGKRFRSRERAYYMGANDYFGPIRNNRPHATPNYNTGKYKFEVDYYRQIYCSPKKKLISEKNFKNKAKKQCILLKVSIITT